MPSVIAIIGAGPGNGLAIARRFATAGFGSALLSRTASSSELVGSLERAGHTARAFEVDAADPHSVRDALHNVERDMGPIGVLVYNAAAVTQTPVMTLAPEQLVRDFTVGVAGALAASQVVAPGMIARGTGSILLTGGGFADRPMAALASLGIEKAAIRNLAFSLAEELQPKGIRVGTVTILGLVKQGTPFDPDKVADAFWELHDDRAGTLGVELKFAGG